MPAPDAPAARPARPIETAELLAVGAELLVGDTRDTNSGDLARELTSLGVEVARVTDLPDRLDVVVGALGDALGRADLVITTGGLGPTPDDLTREAIARVCGEEPVEDPTIEAWLRDRFERRGLPYADANRKQAWLIPSATALPNPNGTAPGWWVDRPDGRVIVALPGPPREMRPMWQDEVLPRLRARGLGADRAAETLRLAGIGESMLVPLIGEEVLRRRNPEVATYARADAVDVRVSAVGERRDGTRARGRRAGTARAAPRPVRLRAWRRGLARGPGQPLAGRTLAIVELGTAGLLAARWAPSHGSTLRRSDPTDPASTEDARGRARLPSATGLARPWPRGRGRRGRRRHARGRRHHGRRTRARGDATAFLGGEKGRRRAANLACSRCGAGWTRTTGWRGPEPRARVHVAAHACRARVPSDPWRRLDRLRHPRRTGVTRGSPGA